ncbi:MAG: LON peptidase substrate-binding domain-containing protein [Halioglobus sp.]
MVDVALFPIPSSVNFPGIPCSLHVFEPRYRQMVRHCIGQRLFMGVCHTEKILHQSERDQTVEEALKRNQATYKPQDVFSAGPVELLEELDDGRMLIQVNNEVRLQLGEEKQTLPFGIWSCEELLDETLDAQGERSLRQSQAKILTRLLAITHDNEDAQDMLKQGHWQAMPAHEFSFAVAGMLGMPTDVAQTLLEMTNAQARLDTVLETINTMGSALS